MSIGMGCSSSVPGSGCLMLARAVSSSSSIDLKRDAGHGQRHGMQLLCSRLSLSLAASRALSLSRSIDLNTDTCHGQSHGMQLLCSRRGLSLAASRASLRQC